MRLTDILSEQRIIVDMRGAMIRDKNESLQEAARLIAPAIGLEQSLVRRLLVERENLQSTGIGDGVAIPHASTDDAMVQAAALVICPLGIDFQSIDGAPVRIVFAVVGPRRATGEHLKTLARISRLLRDGANRDRLVSCSDGAAAYELIQAQDTVP